MLFQLWGEIDWCLHTWWCLVLCIDIGNDRSKSLDTTKRVIHYWSWYSNVFWVQSQFSFIELIMSDGGTKVLCHFFHDLAIFQVDLDNVEGCVEVPVWFWLVVDRKWIYRGWLWWRLHSSKIVSLFATLVAVTIVEWKVLLDLGRCSFWRWILLPPS